MELGAEFTQGNATIKNVQEEPNVSDNSGRTLEMELVLGQLVRMGIRWWKKQKVLDMNSLIRSLAIDGIYVYFVDDMIDIDFDLDVGGINLFNSIKAVLVKAGMEWSADTFLKLQSPKKFMMYVMDQALVEGILIGYDMVKDQIAPPGSGLAKIFI